MLGDLAKPRLGPLLDRASAAHVDADLQRARRTGPGAVSPPRGALPERGAPTSTGASGSRADRLADQPPRVVDRVRRRVVVDRQVEQRSAAAAREPRRAPRAGGGQREVGADVGLEVDREIVAPRSPARGLHRERRAATSRPSPASREPRGVQRLDPIDARDRRGDLAVPAADDQVDRRAGRQRAQLGEGWPVISRSPMRSSRKQRIRARRRRVAPPEGAPQRDRRQQRIRRRRRAPARADRRWSGVPCRVRSRPLSYRHAIDHDAEVAVVGRAEHHPRIPRRRSAAVTRTGSPVAAAAAATSGGNRNVVLLESAADTRTVPSSRSADEDRDVGRGRRGRPSAVVHPEARACDRRRRCGRR